MPSKVGRASEVKCLFKINYTVIINKLFSKRNDVKVPKKKKLTENLLKFRYNTKFHLQL